MMKTTQAKSQEPMQKSTQNHSIKDIFLNLQKIKSVWFLFFVFAGILANGPLSEASDLYDAKNLQVKNSPKISLEQFTKSIPKGAILVLGEQHNLASIQQGQLDILKALRKTGHKINVGLEFLKYTDQPQLDAYLKGQLSEEEFKKSSWGQADFKFYRSQILFPNPAAGEKAFAINSPTNIPLAVKEKGLANLSIDEKALLPPNFELGGANYKERFVERMSGHVKDPEAMNRYFETQSVWDDTMAWKTCQGADSSTNTMVIVVGQFHVEYGDGLIHRIQTRCGNKHPIISVYEYLFYNDEAVDFTDFIPSTKYGPLSDFLMIVRQD
jgi:uncharacterized iron-regulated protein